jgi:hypothetical protein
LLALTLKEKYILKNINEHLDRIETQDTRRQFLTVEEVQALYNTPAGAQSRFALFVPHRVALQ